MINFFARNTAKTGKRTKMSIEVSEYERIIIRKNRQYLRGKQMGSGPLVWDCSPYMAWHTQDTDMARKVALKTGGSAMLFNPVVGKVSVL